MLTSEKSKPVIWKTEDIASAVTMHIFKNSISGYFFRITDSKAIGNQEKFASNHFGRRNLLALCKVANGY